MNVAVGLMDGLGLDGDQCIRMIPRQQREEAGGQKEKGSGIVGEVCDSVTHNIQFINL